MHVLWTTSPLKWSLPNKASSGRTRNFYSRGAKGGDLSCVLGVRLLLNPIAPQLLLQESVVLSTVPYLIVLVSSLQGLSPFYRWDIFTCLRCESTQISYLFLIHLRTFHTFRIVSGVLFSDVNKFFWWLQHYRNYGLCTHNQDLLPFAEYPTLWRQPVHEQSLCMEALFGPSEECTEARTVGKIPVSPPSLLCDHWTSEKGFRRLVWRRLEGTSFSHCKHSCKWASLCRRSLYVSTCILVGRWVYACMCIDARSRGKVFFSTICL